MLVHASIQILGMRTLRERLTWALGHSGLSQRALGRMSGVSERNVGFLINEDRESVEMKTVQSLANALQVSLDWLVNGSEPQPDPAAIRLVGDAFVAKEQAEAAARKEAKAS